MRRSEWQRWTLRVRVPRRFAVGQPRPPSPHVSAILLVVGAERPVQRWLLVEVDNRVRHDPEEDEKAEEWERRVEERGTPQRGQRADIHRIPNEPIWATHDQLARRIEYRGGALSDGAERHDAPERE